MKASLTLFGTAVSCRQCLSLLTNGLEKVNGIDTVSADLQEDALVVDYDPGALDEDAIRAKVRSLGFTKEHLYCIC